MARPRKAAAPLKSRMVTFRLAPEMRARLESDAANAGMSLTDFITSHLAQRRRKPRRQAAAEAPRLPDEVFSELRRIGNNVNQIAHAVNSSLPPDVQYAYRQASRLLALLLADELAARHKSLRTRTAAHGSAHSQTGIELQRGVRVYPARSGQEDS